MYKGIIAIAAVAVSLTADAGGVKVNVNKTNGDTNYRLSVNSGHVAGGYAIHVNNTGYQGHVHGQYCRWIEGYYVTRTQTVWVDGQWVPVWVPPVYRGQIARGQRVEVLAREGYWDRVWVPGHYEQRLVQIWAPGRWSCCGY